jgi:hypothetical protein
MSCFNALQALVGDETPSFGRCANGGFWSVKVKNAFIFQWELTDARSASLLLVEPGDIGNGTYLRHR